MSSSSELSSSPSRRTSLCNPERSKSILLRRTSIDMAESQQADAVLAPEVEGRIFIVSDKVGEISLSAVICCVAGPLFSFAMVFL